MAAHPHGVVLIDRRACALFKDEQDDVSNREQS